MEKLAEVIRIIAERHLLPSIASLVGAGIVYLLVPNDWWVISKLQTLTPHGFFWLVAGLFFLAINLIKSITVRVTTWNKEKARKQHNARISLNGSNEAKIVWHMIDQLTAEQMSCVNQLVKRNNRPIKVRKDIESDNWWKHNNTDVIREKGQDRRGPYTLYSLGESLYKILSKLYRLNGSIMRDEK